MTLREWADAHPGAVLDGLVLTVPQRLIGAHAGVPQADMALRSAWGMGGGLVGIWFQLPHTYPEGQSWPVTGLDFENDVMNWPARER